MNRTYYVITVQEFFLRPEAEQQGKIVEHFTIKGNNFRNSSKITSVERIDVNYRVTTQDGKIRTLSHNAEVEVESLTAVEKRERMTRSLVELLDKPLTSYNIARMQSMAIALDMLNLQDRVERLEAKTAQQNGGK